MKFHHDVVHPELFTRRAPMNASCIDEHLSGDGQPTVEGLRRTAHPATGRRHRLPRVTLITPATGRRHWCHDLEVRRARTPPDSSPGPVRSPLACLPLPLLPSRSPHVGQFHPSRFRFPRHPPGGATGRRAPQVEQGK